jgi:septal ring factor EnvC (AmiA/AmiB activator)
MVMKKTYEQIEAELEREQTYTRKVNDKYERIWEENKELKKRLAEYEQKMSKLKRQLSEYSGSKAGRKRIATKEIAARVLELHEQGFAQGKIAAKLTDEMKMSIGRTTVGEIVRGKYMPSDE